MTDKHSDNQVSQIVRQSGGGGDGDSDCIKQCQPGIAMATGGTGTGTVPLLLPENGACGGGGYCVCHPSACRAHQMTGGRGGKECTHEEREERREFREASR